jgi:cytosine/adenosine deaminase-related metal-dependent hydrolase
MDSTAGNDAYFTLKARWVFPVDQPPIENGMVTIADGRIVSVEPAGERSADQDLGNAALVPGFANAHCHLDLTGARGQIPHTANFTDWLKAVIRYRRTRAPEQVQADIETGIRESVRFGTTLIGDISNLGQSWASLAQSPMRATVFYELLGLTRTRAQEAWARCCDWLRSHPAHSHLRPGLSPHAPYSVRRALFQSCARLAREHDLALAVHLAESDAELSLISSREGPFVSFLKELDVWDEEGLIDRPEEVIDVARGCRLLCVHANFLSPAVPIPAETTVIYCPRTHAAFGHPAHPFRRLLDRGVRVALGTDSLASNPDLDLFAEAKFIHQRHPDLDGGTLLKMATLNGATALGWENETGSLTEGKSVDLLVVSLPVQRAPDPHALLFRPESQVQLVMVRGRWIPT